MMTTFALTDQDRVSLELIAAQTKSSRQLRRAQALIWLDEGESVERLRQAGVLSGNFWLAT